MPSNLQSPRPSLDKTQQLLSQAQPMQQAPMPQEPMQEPMQQGPMQQPLMSEEPAPPMQQGAEEYIGGDVPGAEQATEDEQQWYERVIMAGQQILFADEKAKAAVAQQLQAVPDDPARGIASVVRTVIGQLDSQTGGAIPETVILPAAAALTEEVAELADAIPTLPPIDEPTLSRAGHLVVMGLAEDYGVEPQEVEQILNQYPEGQRQQIAQSQSRYYG
jgi:hypothetical protein